MDGEKEYLVSMFQSGHAPNVIIRTITESFFLEYRISNDIEVRSEDTPFGIIVDIETIWGDGTRSQILSVILRPRMSM